MRMWYSDMWGAVEIFRYLRYVILGGDGVVDYGGANNPQLGLYRRKMRGDRYWKGSITNKNSE